MSFKKYTLGTLIRFSAIFLDVSNQPVDPSLVGFEFKPTNGSPISYTSPNANIVQDSPGHYHVDVDANVAGIWYYRWSSTGTGQAAAEGSFQVATSQFQ